MKRHELIGEMFKKIFAARGETSEAVAHACPDSEVIILMFRLASPELQIQIMIKYLAEAMSSMTLLSLMFESLEKSGANMTELTNILTKTLTTMKMQPTPTPRNEHLN